MYQSQARTFPLDDASIDDFTRDARLLEEAVQHVIIGQESVVRQTILALIAGGHVLLEGVPGVGKTLLVRTLGAALRLSFSRIQFTPDLMPADITGTTILREDQLGRRDFVFQAGPLFANLVLADEVNRATPKTQSALLEAMQESTVTVGTNTHQLPSPFFVLATQNPLEMEGTYPLPEAQLDRFLLKIHVGFPPPPVLHGIVRQTLVAPAEVEGVVDGSRLTVMSAVARAVPVASAVIDYAIAIVMATHPESSSNASVRRFVRAGASPRGVQSLILTAQARALLEGRFNVSIGDIRELAYPALRHRILLNFEGQAEGTTTDQIIDEILAEAPVP
ncbi:MAG: AAA family ATPase [Chloroflexota bacterium]